MISGNFQLYLPSHEYLSQLKVTLHVRLSKTYFPLEIMSPCNDANLESFQVHIVLLSRQSCVASTKKLFSKKRCHYGYYCFLPAMGHLLSKQIVCLLRLQHTRCLASINSLLSEHELLQFAKYNHFGPKLYGFGTVQTGVLKLVLDKCFKSISYYQNTEKLFDYSSTVHQEQIGGGIDYTCTQITMDGNKQLSYCFLPPMDHLLINQITCLLNLQLIHNLLHQHMN